MRSNAYGEPSVEGKAEETDIDPPKLKKARYLWEVKGNYHLKEDKSSSVSHENTSQTKVSPIEDDSNKESEKNHSTPSTCNKSNRNLESFQDHCCVQTFLERTEKFFHTNTEEFSERSSYPHINEANFLKWHNKQMVRYDIENKINAAIEACLGDNPTEYVNLDISNIVEEVENDIEVKDQGILMAIESCGLKTNDCIHRELQQDVCHVNNIHKQSESSVSDLNESLNKTKVPMTDSLESISDDNSLKSDEPRNSEINSKFWNTALSAAIYEKGLTYFE